MAFKTRDKKIRQKISWLINRPNIATYFISSFYPLNRSLLFRYEEILDWSAITINEKIIWDINMIDRFKTRLHVAGRFYNLQYDDLVLECSNNPTIPWSEKLIKVFENGLNQELLAQNKFFRKNEDLVNKYTSDDLFREYNIGGQESCDWKDTNEVIHRLDNIWLTTTEVTDLYDSSCKTLPDSLIPPIEQTPLEKWNISIIKKYENHIDWVTLSQSLKIKWSIELITAFISKWDIECLSCNFTVPFRFELLRVLSKERPDFNESFRPKGNIWNSAFGDLGSRQIRIILKNMRISKKN